MSDQQSQTVSSFAIAYALKERTPRDMFLLALYYKTDIAGINIVGTSDIKEVYDALDISIPSNFGGEIRALRSQKYLSRNTFTLTKKGRDYCKSMCSSSPPIKKTGARKHVASNATISIQTLHPKIRAVSEKLYNDQHYSQAVFEAYKAVVNEVKSISGITNLDGKPLMEKVFSLNNPLVKLNQMVTLSDRDEQQGFMFLFSGAALGIRNPKAHDNIVTKDEYRALEYLVFASLLMSRLDERVD